MDICNGRVFCNIVVNQMLIGLYASPLAPPCLRIAKVVVRLTGIKNNIGRNAVLTWDFLG